VGIPGVKLAAVGRFTLYDSGRMNLALTAAPAFVAYFWPSFASLGFAVPFDLTLGIPISSSLAVGLDFDAPLFVTFGKFGGVDIPLTFGGGLEYFFDRGLAATLSLRAGPMLNSNTSQTYVVFQSMLGVAFKI